MTQLLEKAFRAAEALHEAPIRQQAREAYRRFRRDPSHPSQPNLRQVHLMHAGLHEELRAAEFVVSAGQMGENLTTRGLHLLGRPTGTRLHLGGSAVVEVTGLRNPCAQLERFQPGLMAAVLGRDENRV